MSIGARWKELREQSGLSLRKFAKLLNVSPTYVSRVETDIEPHGYSLETSILAVLILKLSGEEAREVLGYWREIHAAKVAVIDQIVICRTFKPEVQP